MLGRWVAEAAAFELGREEIHLDVTTNLDDLDLQDAYEDGRFSLWHLREEE